MPAKLFKISSVLCLFLGIFTLPTRSEILSDPIKYTITKAADRDFVRWQNTATVPVTVWLRPRLQNTSVMGPNEVFVIPAKGTVEETVFSRTDPRWSWRYDIGYLYNFGSTQVVEPSGPFALPWAKGGSFETGPAFGGIDHTGSGTFCVDFLMPEGTAIHAAKAGLVTHMEEKFSVGGKSPDLLQKANFVCIAHPDGTVSQYEHFQRQGVEVSLGQWVETGQLIGYSGSTGQTYWPHLHFSVVRPTTASGSGHIDMESVRFKLLFHGDSITPKQGQVLSH